MSTPKDAYYKQRQAEFRRLNKRKHKSIREFQGEEVKYKDFIDKVD